MLSRPQRFALLVKAGLRRHDGAGIPGQRRACRRAAPMDTLTAVYNDLDSVRGGSLCGQSGIRDRAQLIMEPVAANMGVVLPEEGFLEGTAETSAIPRMGALLIFDEVITGFSLGLTGAQGYLRRDAGPGHIRKDHRRRHAGRLLTEESETIMEMIAPLRQCLSGRDSERKSGCHGGRYHGTYNSKRSRRKSTRHLEKHMDDVFFQERCKRDLKAARRGNIRLQGQAP